MNNPPHKQSRTTATVMQGKYLVSDDPKQELATVLGSCVSACLFDPTIKVGGMNHFLLPEPSANSPRSVVHGAQAMELLLNDLLKRGAKKSRIKGKLFGGSKILKSGPDIGLENATFALKFLAAEGIPCVAKRLGGYSAMRVRFIPVTGEVLVRVVSESAVEMPKQKVEAPTPNVTLF